MPNRFDRTLPWALFMGMAALLLMGLTWDAAFEATPANSDLVSQGDDRIRDLKVETRTRSQFEHCFGSAGGSGCTADGGAHREGSARVFYENAAPGALLNPTANVINNIDDQGRVWIDADGADNVAANNDDLQIRIWDDASWRTVRWEALGGITLTAIANGNILKYNGTVLVNQAVATLITRDTAAFADGETFTNGTCAVDCTVADVPDHSGGTDTGGYAEVTVPAAPSGVTWDIYVSGHVQYAFTSANAGNVVLEVEYDINDADTFLNQLVLYGQGNTSGNINNQADNFVISEILTGATAGSAYSFRVKITDNGAGTADWDVGTIAAVQTDDFIRVEVRPRTIF